MKASAEKTSTTSSTSVAKVARQPFFAPAVQAKMTVSKVGEHLEPGAQRAAGRGGGGGSRGRATGGDTAAAPPPPRPPPPAASRGREDLQGAEARGEGPA